MVSQSPKFDEEQKLWQSGHDCVVGVDEVGRGPLAGPVVASACFFQKGSKKDFEEFLNLGVKDSKKVTPKKREEIFLELEKNETIKYGIGIVDEKTIDKINILQASLLAMKIAFLELDLKNGKNTFILVDGREVIPDIQVSQKSIIGGDAKIFSIAVASIIAKVTRDKIMKEYANKYPKYGFEKHKGYGTKFHFEMIKKYGSCDIHRKSFLH